MKHSLLVLLALLIASPAFAHAGGIAPKRVEPQPSSPAAVDDGYHESSKGRFRIGLETVFLGKEAHALVLDGSDATMTVGASFVGITQSAGFGPVLSYGISDDVLLTGRVSLASTRFGSTSTTRVFLLPSIEYVLIPDQTLRPVIGAGLGLMHDASSGVDGAGTTTVTRVMIGANAGLSYFADRHVSLDLTLLVCAGFGVGSMETVFGEAADLTSSGYAIALTAGLSYWN